ncbi:MAG: hypothetical protein IJS59_10475 [Bacteroidaceae bacterium]|nr:hypothetical protein [Bacteroidaceae bacterium]
MTTKRLFTLIILGVCCLNGSSQTAREVLDATAALTSGKGGVRATFIATQFQGTTPKGETQGTLFMHGRQFKLRTNDLTVWYDGSQQWSMMRGSQEVNLTEPTETEVAETNPAVLIGIYKSGYAASLAEGTLRGKATYVVTLTPTSSASAYEKIILDVERAGFTPLCIRAKQHGNWLRLAIMTFETGQKVTAADFTFPKKLFPEAEVIDLR